MEKYTVSEKFLSEIVDYSARSLVGKIFKRYSIIGNEEEIKDALKEKDIPNNIRKIYIEVLNAERAIKKVIKELIYENHRDLAVFIKSFSKGENIGAVEFISNKEPDRK